jgi:2-polyprenyl-3-methyl-5-hydroxy-6-metoxy-1,4-benzoquinol methylase
MTSKVDYDRVWKEDWKDITSYGPSYRTRYRLIKKLMKKYELTKGDLLDAGCGDGTLLVSLQKLWPELKLYGFDISRSIIQKNKDKISLTIGDLTKEKTIPKKKFDIILCSEVLEHITPYPIAIKNLTRMLKPGGCLIITSPYGQKNWTPHDKFAHHVRRWEDNMIETELKKNKVAIVESFTWGRVIYGTYYHHFLAKQDPKRLMKKKGFLKEKVFAPLLYHAFKLDDGFKTKGRTIIVVGKKRNA